MSNNYEDIISLSHPEPKNHHRMSMKARAAQFAPFSALTGHQDALSETARLTDETPILDQQSCIDLDCKVNILIAKLAEQPLVSFTIFEADKKKSGGRYLELQAKVLKFNEIDRVFTLFPGQKLPLNSVIDLKFL